MITNFHSKEIPKEKTPCKRLSITMIDSVIKPNRKYYPQTHYPKYYPKYVQEKIKTENYPDKDLEKSELDSESNNETESDVDNDENDE